MADNNHVDLNVRISRELNDELLRHCSKTGEKKAHAVRRAIADLIVAGEKSNGANSQMVSEDYRMP